MIAKPDEPTFDALKRVALSHDGQLLLTWLRDNYDKTKDQLVSSREQLQIYQTQGAALTLRTLLEFAQESLDY